MKTSSPSTQHATRGSDSPSTPPPHVGGYGERFLDYDKSLACIHCGLCLASCPTYLETGNENDSPRGRIYLMRAVQDGRLPLGDTAVRHIDLCLGCRACEAVCPSGVQYGELLEATRDHIEKKYDRSLFQRFLRRVMIEKIFPFPRRMKAALLPAIWIKKLGIEGWLPQFLRESFSLVPEDANAVTLPETSPALTESSGRVGFISGCVMSVMFGKTNAASVRLLNRAGFDVVTPATQVCCGALYAHGGNLAQARACARRNIEVFEPLNLDAIIINAAGCGSTLKEYGHLLHEDPVWAQRAQKFSAKVKDLTEWLVSAQSKVQGPRAQLHPASRSASDEPCPLTPPLSPSGGEGARRAGEGVAPGFKASSKVTYHDACHLAHPQRITGPPRELIHSVAGRDFIELPESDVCCGSAGSYNLTEPEMAERLQRRKVENILKTGATVVVTTNPGCILQIRAGLRKAGASHVRVLHIADFLEEITRE